MDKDPLSRPARILAAASRLVAHYGFNKTTVDDIASEAGVSKGAVYLEWPGKDELFDALLAYEMKRMLTDYRGRIEADPEGGRIANLYRHALLALHANPLICALYVRDSRILGDFVRRQDVERYTSRLLLGNESIRQMQAAGLLRDDIRPETVAYLFTIIALGFIQVGAVLPMQDVPQLEEVAQAVTRMVEGGLAREGGDSAAGKQAFLKVLDLMMEQYGAVTGTESGNGGAESKENSGG
ncbi:MAG TPA: TetR/AcrR family transcriptional regulator [Anaerolineales bacterium]|nr:TetR/AcrR family transcriptional regulator [Anaerolineales bacterium]